MRIQSQAQVHGSWVKFEFEGSLTELAGLPSNISKLKDCLKILASKE